MSTSANRPDLSMASERAQQELSAKHEAREAGLRISREVIRLSANAIRAVHRHDLDEAASLISQASDRLEEADTIREQSPEIYYSGFLADARKEFAEANITLALISGNPIPQAEALGVEMSSYLNGMGEVIGELRRYVLDSLRRNETGRCEELMQVMDDIYSLLVTVDFPEGVTGGLRRTTDAMRGVLERTRGDLTMTLRQLELEKLLGGWQEHLSRGADSLDTP